MHLPDRAWHRIGMITIFIKFLNNYFSYPLLAITLIIISYDSYS
nr:MAG TPA: hypothetical protein [Caudoviricetes sp.]